MINIEWRKDTLVLLDQTKLPTEITYVHCTDWRQVAEAIKMLRVRGAPAIGVAASYGLILAAMEAGRLEAPFSEQLTSLYEFSETLKETRPTAINLAWAVDRVISLVKTNVDSMSSMSEVVDLITKEAIIIHEEDVSLNRRMAEAGATLFEADETRPLLQGARLTAFELHEDGIPITLETDNMAAYAMQHGLIDAVIVGADRITTKGDVANKIGTYGVAVLAKFHNIPFYVAAPYSTFDFTLENGGDIPIEMRNDDEVTALHGVQTAPSGIDVLNPAFDVTPHELVTAIITEEGVLTPNYEESIGKLRQIVESK
ncbi:MAG: S-methyl-5-thioribose-1-phosphate isomerase [Veillonella sp.]|nr:S-methyl-5-thioribose-1-phosphate isomerase [Veillonella sp.]